MKKINQALVFSLGFLFILNSCTDLEDTTFSQETTDTYFDTVDDIELAAVAAYHTLSLRFGGRDVFNQSLIELGTLGTHLGWWTNNIGRHKYLEGTDASVQNSYRGSYFGISKANLVLQKLDEKNGADFLIPMDDELRDYYRAQMRFIRGLFYFNLVQFYNEVPIVTEPFDGILEGSQTGKSSTQEIYDFIVADLLYAEDFLPERDFSKGNELGRATKGAAQGMLARVYLAMAGYPLNLGQPYYQLAKDQCLKVIDSGIYDLKDDYTSLFYVANENDNEWLFTVQFGPQEELTGSWGWWQTVFARWKNSGLRANKTDGVKRMNASQELAESYDASDPRFIYNIITTNRPGRPEKPWKYNTLKFRFAEDYLARNRSGMNAPILRYADILLMIAEAENELNGPANAYQYINEVRARARQGSELNDIAPSTEPADLSGLTQEEFRDEVFWERGRELCWEGMDRLDLVRSGKFVELLNNATYNVKEGSVIDVNEDFIFFPIPEAAVLNNPLLD